MFQIVQSFFKKPKETARYLYELYRLKRWVRDVLTVSGIAVTDDMQLFREVFLPGIATEINKINANTDAETENAIDKIYSKSVGYIFDTGDGQDHGSSPWIISMLDPRSTTVAAIPLMFQRHVFRLSAAIGATRLLNIRRRVFAAIYDSVIASLDDEMDQLEHMAKLKHYDDKYPTTFWLLAYLFIEFYPNTN